MTRRKAQVVEIEPTGVRWIKSSVSGATGGQSCVEFAADRNTVLVRNSRHRDERLTFPGTSWSAFLARQI